ncbi:MAG TPA: exosortase system-associated protein, TIGR04073 family [Chthoniobacterales bacterium]|jgi:putative exosortase-associated protein (TIGR04073 family)
MRWLFALVLGLACAGSLLGDIQDPPATKYGPSRKLGRGLSNIFFGWSEVPAAIAKVNEQEGNSATASYGLLRGADRAFARFGVGLYEAILWPLPLYRGSYCPILCGDTHWVHHGYSEFPPELGNESKYPYVREY